MQNGTYLTLIFLGFALFTNAGAQLAQWEIGNLPDGYLIVYLPLLFFGFMLFEHSLNTLYRRAVSSCEPMVINESHISDMGEDTREVIDQDGC